MKAISLHQPWASLMACGAKSVETRSWKTGHRGPLLICSTAKQMTKETIKFLQHDYVQAALTSHFGVKEVLPEHFSYGTAICMVELYGVMPVEKMHVFEREKTFGDYSEGRFGWITMLARPVQLVQIKGKQRIFEVDDWWIVTGKHAFSRLA